MFDGIYVQGGSQGAVQAMLDSGKFKAPISGETENAFRMLCDKARPNLPIGWHGAGAKRGGDQDGDGGTAGRSHSAEHRAADFGRLLAVQAGRQCFPKLPGSFFAGNNFPSCDIGFSAEEIATQSGNND